MYQAQLRSPARRERGCKSGTALAVSSGAAPSAEGGETLPSLREGDDGATGTPRRSETGAHCINNQKNAGRAKLGCALTEEASSGIFRNYTNF